MTANRLARAGFVLYAGANLADLVTTWLALHYVHNSAETNPLVVAFSAAAHLGAWPSLLILKFVPVGLGLGLLLLSESVVPLRAELLQRRPYLVQLPDGMRQAAVDDIVASWASGKLAREVAAWGDRALRGRLGLWCIGSLLAGSLVVGWAALGNLLLLV
jgi:hypothetical protein